MMFASDLLEKYQILNLSAWSERLNESVEEFLAIEIAGSESFRKRVDAAKASVSEMLQTPEAWFGEDTHRSPVYTAALFYKEVRLRAEQMKRRMTQCQCTCSTKDESNQNSAAEQKQLLLVEQSLRQSITHIGAWNLSRLLTQYLSKVEEAESDWRKSAAEVLASEGASYLECCRLGLSRRSSVFPEMLENLIPQAKSSDRTELLRQAKKTVGFLADFEPDRHKLLPEVNVRLLSIKPLASSIPPIRNEG